MMTDFFIRLPHHDARITSGFRLEHFIFSNDPILRQPLPAQLREDRFAARDLDELFDPLNAGDERVVPFLEERPRARRKRLCGPANVVETALQPCRERLSLRFAADQAGEYTDHLENLCDRSLVEREDRPSAADEL